MNQSIILKTFVWYIKYRKRILRKSSLTISWSPYFAHLVKKKPYMLSPIKFQTLLLKENRRRFIFPLLQNKYSDNTPKMSFSNLLIHLLGQLTKLSILNELEQFNSNKLISILGPHREPKNFSFDLRVFTDMDRQDVFRKERSYSYHRLCDSLIWSSCCVQGLNHISTTLSAASWLATYASCRLYVRICGLGELSVWNHNLVKFNTFYWNIVTVSCNPRAPLKIATLKINLKILYLLFRILYWVLIGNPILSLKIVLSFAPISHPLLGVKTAWLIIFKSERKKWIKKYHVVFDQSSHRLFDL